MAIDREEQIVILYALISCGGKGSKGRIIDYILQEQLLKSRDGDDSVRQGRETKVENDLAWARQDLKDRGLLAMPEHGKSAITEEGRRRMRDKAKLFFSKPPSEELFARFSANFIGRMRDLGEKVTKEDSESTG